MIALRWWIVILLSGLLVAAESRGQPPRSAVKVRGRLIRIYRSQDNRELLEVRLASVAGAEGGTRRPAPGETIYIQITPGRGQGIRAGQEVQGLIEAQPEGTWSAVDLVPAATTGGTPVELTRFRGLQCETTRREGRLGLEVKRVSPDTPGQAAGFQRGDVIIAIDGQPLRAAQDLGQLSDRPRAVELQVIDVNSGRVADVTVRADRTSRAAVNNVGATIRDRWGVTFEEGPADGLRVRTVRPDSPGGRAGLEAGDLVVRVGEQRVGTLRQLADALPSDPQNLTVVVRDVRTGQEVPVEIRFAPADVAPDRTEATEASRKPTNRLGMVTELTFFDAEAAVKVVRVSPGSVADQAGLRAGMILQKANGRYGSRGKTR